MSQDLDVIIAGGGRVGFQTARLLADRGHSVTVVERDPEVVDAIADEWVATVIHGDATHPDILQQAGIDSADAVAALTGEAGLNLAVCLTTRELTAGTRTVARVDHAARTAYERFVDAIVFPERAGARAAANEIVRSDVQTLADVTGDLDIMEVTVVEGAPAAGRTLADVALPTGALVVSDGQGDKVASPETVLEPGERFVVAVEPDVAEEVLNLLRG